MKIQHIYEYRDADDNLAYEVVRFIPKDFRPRMPDGTWGLTAERILYNLPSIIAHRTDNFVWVCEGEKDADRLIEHGLIATTTGAASSWDAADTKPIDGAWGVVVIPDCDPAGVTFADSVARDMVGRVRIIQVLELGGIAGYDLSDYLDDHDLQDLLTMRSNTAPWKAKKPRRKRAPYRTGRRAPQRATTPGLPYNIDDLAFELGDMRSRYRGKGQVVYCPAHDDEGGTPGLSLTAIDDETTLAYCHSGCDFPDIAKAVRERMEPSG